MHYIAILQRAELAALTEQLEAKDAALAQQRARLEELSLQYQGTQQVQVLFSLPSLVTTTYSRLHGPPPGQRPSLPHDREGATLLPVQQGTTLLLIGGQGGVGSKGEPSPRDVWLLNLTTKTWDRLPHAKMSFSIHSHAAVCISPAKIMLFGGFRNGDLSADITYFTTDSHKWTLPLLRGTVAPLPRTGHCMAAVRERVYVFGGKTARALSAELWVFDLEMLTWTRVLGYGQEPSARYGASMAATDNGRCVLWGRNRGFGV